MSHSANAYKVSNSKSVLAVAGGCMRRVQTFSEGGVPLGGGFGTFNETYTYCNSLFEHMILNSMRHKMGRPEYHSVDPSDLGIWSKCFLHIAQ